MKNKIKPLSLLGKNIKKTEYILRTGYLNTIYNSLKQSLNRIKAKAVEKAPVKTGLLRSSITYAIKGKGHSNIYIKIGSDLDYAMIQEKKHKKRKWYLKSSIEEEMFSGKFIKMFEKNLETLLSAKLKGSNKKK